MQLDLLKEETRAKYQYDPTNLPYDSNALVVVRCSNCKEIFDREFRLLHSGHNCPTHITKDSLKYCCECESYKPYAEFENSTVSYDGLSAICASCAEYLVIAVSTQTRYSRDATLLNRNAIERQLDKQHWRCFRTNSSFFDHDNAVRDVQFEKLCDSEPFGVDNFVVSLCHATNGTPSDRVRLEVKLIHEAAKYPFRKRITDAGYDIFAIEEKVVPAQGYAIIDTGVIISPPAGYYYTVEGRSSLGLLGITPFRGIIDGTYQGELKITLINRAFLDYTVRVNDRIAQIILHRVLHADFAVVDQFSPVTDGRQSNGFGSSGK